MELNLTGKIAMISGASRGLGYAVAHALASEGARVSISSSNAASIEAAGRRIREDTGAEVLAMAADVCSAEALSAWHQATLDRFGGIDLLYANSGGPAPGPT